MRRAILTLLSTVAGLVLLLNFKTSATTAVAPAVGASGTSSASAAPSSSSSTSSSGSSSSASGSSGSGSGTKTLTGSSVDTRWGPVQVRITVTNGKITAANAIDYPNSNGHDQEINSTAIPTLNSEAVSAGNAQIDQVSGATYTSEGYIASLQSALDQAS
ncbi:MAG: hypothetical protein QOG60_1691 [Frankiaceae bacterium]|jgi:uncharacterized protein with FMN-binding domain|nr:hypothetical protein [Frankiaceae bacterium]MDQ1649634.1 hypothetical protein [Frankiaceae bacterium]MDQ1673791.1 hypothetical protein [Frankiaceae bacterium]